MAYSRTPDITDPAITPNLTSTLLNGDMNDIVTEGRALTEDAINTAGSISFRKAERPWIYACRSGYISIGTSNLAGHGKPFAIEGERQPPIDLDADVSVQLLQSQQFENVVAVIRTPSWTDSSSITPLLRLHSVSVTCIPRVTYAQRHSDVTADATSGGTQQYADEQEVADDLILRAYRIQTSNIRKRVLTDDKAGEERIEIASTKNELSIVGEKIGMTSRGPRSAANGRAGIDWNLLSDPPLLSGLGVVPGSLDDVWHFQAMGKLTRADLGESPPLREDDSVVISLSGQERLLFASETTYESDKPNSIFPVGGVWWMAFFEAEFAE
jgi:hypothetical protein